MRNTSLGTTEVDNKAYVKSARILNVLELFAPSTCLSFELALWYGWVR